ncbi:hypothetical protein BUALT_Bualt01G0168000 [Buddleja alternifolia]|uniref:Late embryogenesis abundant protein LEA-2 subgroup domain-containing protein n=1 Tax=Buddleja alternifolia TaxID=168488 RepID=A0AAV6YIM5_9LAMI|nr:hypothetical protein BUALT_Bualt01G0168000 [Buddleja alternifolia]
MHQDTKKNLLQVSIISKYNHNIFALSHTLVPNYRMDSEEEALFRSYPYSVYFVQSPSAISHANSNTNNSGLTFHPSQDATRLALSRYFNSSRGSNNSFLQDDEKKLKLSHEQSHDHGTENGGAIIMKNGVEHQVDDHEEDQDIDEDEYDYDEGNKGFLKYLSFSYSNSGWWICLQLSWRLLLSLMIALIVFYIAAKPPAPRMSIKMAGIRQFRLGEGVDSSGVTTKILSCNCSMDLIIDNKSKLFGLHIHPPTMEILFVHLPFAISQGKELYAGSADLTLFKLSVGIRNKAMYGAGRNMQDLLESGKGLPLVIRVSFRSSFHVVWGLFQPKFHHQAQCLVLLSDKYDKKNRTQVYKSNCVSNP